MPEFSLVAARFPKEVRDSVSVFLYLDDQMARMALRPGNPMLARIRLAWWAEALAGQRSAEVRDPILKAALANPLLDTPVFLQIIEAWDGLCHGGRREDDYLTYARIRGRVVFEGLLAKVGWAGETEKIGMRWALLDLAARQGHEDQSLAFLQSLALRAPPARILRTQHATRTQIRAMRGLARLEALRMPARSPLAHWWSVIRA